LITKPGTRLTWLYLLTQAVSGFLWWVWLALAPDSRLYFIPSGLSDKFLVAFAIPDLIIFVFGSLITSIAYIKKWSCGAALIWTVAGATLYATLLCIGIQIAYGDYMPPTLMMLAASVCTVSLASTSKPSDSLYPKIPFRESRAGTATKAAFRTLVQVAIFWGLFLLLIPVAIAYVERGIGIQGVESKMGLGIVVFVAASVLGLSSAWSMSWYGLGTPFPTDTAPKLVTSGPYRVVRNPMVIAGLLQGIGVLLMLGSLLMIPYIVIGGIYWQLCVRPVEEQDLSLRFGDEYLRYRARVSCWIPGCSAL